MKFIKETVVIQETNIDTFHNTLNGRIKELQNDGLEVDIQCSFSPTGNGVVVYSALVVGRKYK